jgi:hypothetical protein
LSRSEAAKAFWAEVYRQVAGDRAGLFGAITNHAEAQVMRMAPVYALLDRSPKIEVVHLQAALALWDYCERSARFVFGDATGDKIADRIVNELAAVGSAGLTRTEIRDVFQHNVSAAKIDEALALRQRLGRAQGEKEARAGQGRPAVIWRATPYAINAINAEIRPARGIAALSALGSNGVSESVTVSSTPVVSSGAMSPPAQSEGDSAANRELVEVVL